jgi:hypothetical protein
MGQPLSLYIDGGIKCNNPITMVHFEASMIWPNRINNALVISTKARGVENRPSAKMQGTPKSLHLENHTKSQ